MRNNGLILLATLLSLISCGKDDTIETSGTVTIDNTRFLSQTYYVYGFLFSQAKLVTTTATTPPDITVDSDGTNIFFQANNFKPSFHKSGEYADEASAKTAFSSLTTASITQWEEWANPIKANQVWIYRSGSEHYAKIRIISIVSEIRSDRPYAECTFEWVYQPDGTLTFPEK